MPEPELNVVITDSNSGQWLSNSDFVWREQKVVAEFDGDHHRTDRRQWQNEVARCQSLQDDGRAFVQLTYARDAGPRNKSTVTRLRHLLTRPWSRKDRRHARVASHRST